MDDFDAALLEARHVQNETFDQLPGFGLAQAMEIDLSLD